MNIKILIILILTITSTFAFGAGEINYSRTLSASEASIRFFGPGTKVERRRRALKVGRVGIHVQNSLNCGKLDFKGSIQGEFDRIADHLGLVKGQVEDLLRDPRRLILGVVCYAKKNACSHIRHMSLLFSESLSMAFDACQAVDNYIDSQAAKGEKENRANAIKACLNRSGKKMTPAAFRKCQEKTGKARDLLKPFRNAVAGRSQRALKSVLKVVKRSENYDIWSQLVGEVEIKKNGYWVKLFPKDQLRPDDVANNMILAGQEVLCNSEKLQFLIEGSGIRNRKGFERFVREVVKERLTMDVIKDLDSLPLDDRNRACTAIGDSVAHLAIKRVVATGRSDFSAGLANDALSDDLRIFYRDRSEKAFKALLSRVEANEVPPLRESLDRLRKLALGYRDLGRDAASKIGSNKFRNSRLKSSNACTDALSCSSR